MLTSDNLNAVLPYAFGNELSWFKTTAQQLPDGAEVVMIGAGPGVMAMALFEGADKPFHLTVIDIQTCHFVQEHLKALGVNLRQHTFIVGDSKAVEWSTPIDLLVVDGDHSYEGVRGDIMAWLKWVKPGGLVFFHDVVDLEQNGTNGVRRALEDSTLEADLWATPGISQVFKKR